jgi:WG containing repeat
MPVPSLLLALALAVTCVCQEPSTQPLFTAEKNGKWGFIDRAGKVIIPVQFDSANEFHDGLALVTTVGRKMFIDMSGKTVITAQFDLVENFSEGLAAVNIGQTRIPNIGLIDNPGKWGYLDKTGKLQFPLKFTHAEDFSEGLAAVKDGNHSGFIDHAGKMVFEVPLDVTLGFHEGVAGVLFKGSIAYYDHTGKKLPISTDYGPKSNSFSSGLLPVSVKGKWGFVDKSGKLLIAPQFEDADNFSEGLAPVKVRSEETTWCPRDESGSREGFTMRWGYIDPSGKTIIPPQFESAAPFVEGLAVIHQCGQAFFIDKTGRSIISANFKYASSFSNGLAQVETMTQNGLVTSYIDRTGRVIWVASKE